MKKLLYIGVTLVILICVLMSVSCSSSTSHMPAYLTTTAIPTTTTTTVFGYSGNGVKTVTPTIIMTVPSASNGSSEQTALSPAPVDTGGGQSSSPDIQRMIVRTSNMSIVVSDIATTLDRISRLAEDSNGYVVSSDKWQDNGRLAGTITIRVPAGQFDNAMSTLRAMADEVTSENTTAQDVTEEYVDLNSTLTNLEATETQLLAIMAKADKIEDILAVQEQLTNTEGQIETTKGRMQYLEQTSATSLITVSLAQSKLGVQLTAMSGRDVRGGQNVYFSADVSGGFSPYNYKWDFGDRTTSTDASPVHAFNSSGKYTVSLTVTDDKGNTATDTRTDYITVQSGWNVGNVAKTAWSGLSSFFHVIVNILIWLGIFSPIWIIAGVIIWWILRRRKMRLAKKANQT